MRHNYCVFFIIESYQQTKLLTASGTRDDDDKFNFNQLFIIFSVQ